MSEEQFFNVLFMKLAGLFARPGRRNRILSVIILISPILLVSIFGIVKSYRIMTDLEIARKRSVVGLSARLIEEKLNDIVGLGMSLALRPMLVEHLGRDNWEAGAEVLRGGLVSNFPFVERVVLTDPQGTIKADFSELPGTLGGSRSSMEWYQGVSRTWQPYVSGAFVRGSEPKANVVNIVIPIKSDVYHYEAPVSPPQRILGILVLQIKLDSFGQWISDMGLKPSEMFFIVDHKGHVVFHPRFPPQGEILDFSTVPLVGDLLKGQERTGYNYNSFEKEERFAATKRIGTYGWGVVLTEPAGVVFIRRDQAVLVAILVHGGFILIGIFLALVLLRLLGRYKKASEEMADLYNHAPCGYHSVDEKGVFIEMNDTELSWLGYSREEVIGRMRYLDLVPQKEKASYAEACKRFREEGRADGLEFHFVRKDGTSFVALISSVAVRDAQGRFVMSRTTVVDITERKRAEELMAESEKRFRAIADYGYDWECWIGMDGRLVWSNPASQRMSGYSPEECMAMADFPFPLIYEEDLPRIRTLFRDIVESQTSGDFEFRLRRKDREVVWVALAWQPIYDDQGQCLGHRSSLRNISLLKHVEQTLVDSEKKYRALFETMAQGVFYQRADGTLTDVNYAALEMFGLTREQFLARACSDPNWKAVREDGSGMPCAEYPTLVALRTGRPVRGVILGVFNPVRDAYVWINANAIPQFRPGEDKPYQVFMTMHDVTERRRLVAEIEANEARFRGMFEHMSSGVVVYDAVDNGEDFWIKDMNVAAERILHAERTDVIGRRVSLTFPAVKEFGLFEVFRRVWRSGISENHPAGLYRDDRLVLWAENYVFRLPSGEIVAVFDDVTERKKWEDALLESEKRFRLFYEGAPLGYQSLDAEGCLIDVNSVWLQTFGYERHEVIGRWFGDFLRPDQVVLFRERFPRFKAIGEVHGVEFEVMRKDGTELSLSFDGKIALDEHGNFRQTHCVLSNITDRKRAKAALEESEERFRVLFENELNAVAIHEIVLDGDGRPVDYTFLQANPAFEKHTGVAVHDVLGRRATEVFPGIEKTDLIQIYGKVALTGEAISFEWFFDQEKRYYNIMAYRVGENKFAAVFENITSRRRMEDALRENEARLQAIVDLSPFGAHIFHLEDDGRLIFVSANRSADRIFGVDHQRLIGKSLDEALPGFIGPKVSTALREVATQGGKFEDDGIIYDPGKARGIFELHAFQAGQNRVVVFSRDMTERKRAEEAVRDSREYLLKIIESVADPLFVKDRSHRWVLFNRAFTRFMGRTAQEILGKSDDQFFPKDQADVFWEKDEEVFKSGLENVNEEFFTDAQGIKRTIITKKALYTDNSGNKFIVGVIRDVTEFKASQEKTQRAAAEWRRTFDSIPDLVFLLDKDSHVVRANKAVFKALDIKPQDLAHKKCHELMHTLAHHCEHCPFVELMQDRKPHTHEVSALNGVPLLVTVSPVFGENGEFLGAVHVARDITEAKRSEKELKEAYDQLLNVQKRLVQSEKMASLGQLAAGIAHEINNPTGYVISNLYTLKEHEQRLLEFLTNITSQTEHSLSIEQISELSERLSIPAIVQDLPKLIEETREGAERIKRIVRDLKSFAHPDSGAFEPGDIHECINTALDLTWNELKYKAEVVKEYGALPQISLKKQAMSQVFVNLFMNAAQAMKERGRIMIKTYVEKDSLYIEVADTAGGMPPEIVSRIFDPFFTTKPVGQGTGLGLSIVHGIIQEHKGEIDVQSELGRGTTFLIRLPIPRA